MQLEVVVTNASEALDAQRAGASRVELVADFDRGGLTPSPQNIESVTRALSIPVHVMVRPHDNGFVYADIERQRILDDAARMRELGAAGIVFGALDRRRYIDLELLREVVSAAELPLTFHRAFDATASLSGAYAILAGITGVERVLTAGGAATAWEGRSKLRELGCGNTVPTVLAAGGIDAENLVRLVQFSGLREVHVGTGARTDGRIDTDKIQRLVKLLEGPVR